MPTNFLFLQPHFRFGHSLLKPTFKRMNTKYADAGPALKLADMFFNPESLHEPGMLDDLMRGMSATSMETLDQVWSLNMSPLPFPLTALLT